jgi:hypothetical protein
MENRFYVLYIILFYLTLVGSFEMIEWLLESLLVNTSMSSVTSHLQTSVRTEYGHIWWHFDQMHVYFHHPCNNNTKCKALKRSDPYAPSTYDAVRLKGCVTLWPCHLHEKVCILRQKKNYEKKTQIFHHAKNIIVKKSSKRKETKILQDIIIL